LAKRASDINSLESRNSAILALGWTHNVLVKRRKDGGEPWHPLYITVLAQDHRESGW
jgi:hypothetical protein